jgi:hypothetical protein
VGFEGVDGPRSLGERKIGRGGVLGTGAFVESKRPHWEEDQVDIHMAAGNSLNMIPGGFKGNRFLHEHRLT